MIIGELKLEGTIIGILTFVIIFLIAFGIIKIIFKPIKTSTALLLTLPTIATCGIALLIYKFFRNANYGTGGTSNIYTSPTYSENNLTNFELKETEELKPKKPASSHTDNFGKTNYYDEQGNYMGEGFTNTFGEITYTDSTGNYVGQSVNNGYGQNTYTNANENITTSNTNYASEDTFDDGTSTSSDSFGNKYYH